MSKEILVERYQTMVYIIAAVICRRLPQHIIYDDLVSSGFQGLLSAIDSFDIHAGVKFPAYAQFRIHGAIMDDLRKFDNLSRGHRASVKNGEDREIEFLEINSVYKLIEKEFYTRDKQPIEKHEESLLIMSKISTLDKQQRLCVLLHYYYDKKLKAIADILNVTESRASQILTAALKKLRMIITKEMIYG